MIRINDEWEMHHPFIITPHEKSPDTPYFNVEEQPTIGLKQTVYEGHRKYIIHEAKKWYDTLENEVTKCGAKMLNTIAGLDMDIFFDNMIIN